MTEYFDSVSVYDIEKVHMWNLSQMIGSHANYPPSEVISNLVHISESCPVLTDILS